jgi:ParB/RepB/Spo0J family partition protein
MTDTTQRDLADLYGDTEGMDRQETADVLLQLIEDLPAAVPADLKRSIQTRGQMVPVILNASEDRETYTIIDGRRRIRAMRDLGMVAVSAVVYNAPDMVGWAMAATANAVRGDNPENELEAIEALTGEGYTESQIAQATGMSVQTIRKRERLLVLAPILREGLKTGKLAIGVAEQIAKLPEEARARAAAIFAEDGKITGHQVRELLAVERDEATASLSEAIFGEPVDEATRWRTTLRQAKERMDTAAFDAAMKELGYVRAEVATSEADQGAAPGGEPAGTPVAGKRKVGRPRKNAPATTG